MRIGVVTTPGSWHLSDLRRAAASLAHDRPGHAEISVELVDYRSLGAHLDSSAETFSAAGAPLAAFDALLIRAMPAASLEAVVFRMDALARAEAAGVLTINSPKAMEAAIDKYLTTSRLAAAGLRVPRTVVCQTTQQALGAFHALGGDVVVKPLFGGEGRGVARLTDDALAERAFSLLSSLGAVFYLQEFIPGDGSDIRVLIVGRRAWAIRRHNPLDWRANLSRGAIATPLEPSGAMVQIAQRAVAAVGAEIAGVDLMAGADGALYAIEVNASPGWRTTAAVLGVDLAAACLDHVRERIAERQR